VPCIDSILELIAAGPGSAVCRLAADALAALAGPAPESLTIEAAVRAAFVPVVKTGQVPRTSRAALARLAQMMSVTGPLDATRAVLASMPPNSLG